MMTNAIPKEDAKQEANDTMLTQAFAQDRHRTYAIVLARKRHLRLVHSGF